MIYPREESFGEISKSVMKKRGKKCLHLHNCHAIISDGLF